MVLPHVRHLPQLQQDWNYRHAAGRPALAGMLHRTYPSCHKKTVQAGLLVNPMYGGQTDDSTQGSLHTMKSMASGGLCTIHDLLQALAQSGLQ